MRFNLTSRQREVLEYIANFISQAGYSPTIREIGAYFNFVPGSVTDHLRALERKGYLRRDPAKSRTLQLVTSANGRKVRYSRERTKLYAPNPANVQKRIKVTFRESRNNCRSKIRSSATLDEIFSKNHTDSLLRDQLRLYTQIQDRERASDQMQKIRKNNSGVDHIPSYEPLASVWDGEDAELLELMLAFYPRQEPKRILDATVNGGRFWKGSMRPVIGMDVEANHKPNLVGNNACMPFRNRAFDVIVYDPPHIPNQGRDKSKDFNTRFGLVLRSTKENGYSFSHTYPPFLKEAYRVLKPEGILFCKISDYIHHHRYQWAHVDFIQAAREVGFFPCDCIIKIRKGPIIDPKWKTAHHTRRQHCYWLVFRKSNKCE